MDPETTAVADPTPTTTPAAVDTPAPVTPAEGASQTPATAPAPATPEYLPVHEAVRQYGYDLPQGLEGAAAVQHLIAQANRARELETLARYGQQYVQHAAQFQTWQQQQAAQAQQGQTKESWWKAPPFESSWRRDLTRDPETGEIKPVAGADPSIVQKYHAAMQHQQQFIDKFSFDPIGTIKPGIEEMVQEVASKLIQQHLGGYQEQQHSQQFIQQHASWLYQRDAQGNTVVNPQTNAPALSPLGERFKGYVQQAEQWGIPSDKQRADYALAMVQRDYLAAQTTQQTAAQTAQQTGQQAKQQFLNGAQHIPNTGGSSPTAANPAAPAQNQRLPLLERMRQVAIKNGVLGATSNGAAV